MSSSAIKTISLIAINIILMGVALWVVWSFVLHTNQPVLAQKSVVEHGQEPLINLVQPNISLLTSAPIFSSSRTPIIPPPIMSSSQTRTLPPRLVGVSVEANGVGYAILQDTSSSENAILKLNETFMGWRIVKIYNDSVSIVAEDRFGAMTQEAIQLYLHPSLGDWNSRD